MSFWAVFKATIAAYLGYVAVSFAFVALIVVGVVVVTVVSTCGKGQ